MGVLSSVVKKLFFPKFQFVNDLRTASNYFGNSFRSVRPVGRAFYVYLTGRLRRLAAGDDQQGETPAGRDQGAAATARGSALTRVRRSRSLFASGAGQPVDECSYWFRCRPSIDFLCPLLSLMTFVLPRMTPTDRPHWSLRRTSPESSH